MRNYPAFGKTPKPIDDVLEWGKWFETANRRVAEANVGNVCISTVFLGLDHNWGPGEPILFETMVFGGHFDGQQRRYATWEEAERGHAEMVRMVKEETP